METQDLLVTMVLTTLATLVVLPIVVHRHALARGLRALLASPLPILRAVASRGLDASSDGLRRVRAWQVIVAAFVVAVAVASLHREAARAGVPGLLALAGIAVVFAMTWAGEVMFLMSLRDEDLPGRFDKPIWVFFLVALPPAGVVLFRAHRLAHWPEPAAKARMAAHAARELA